MEQESTSDGWIFTFAIVYTIIDNKINTNTSPENLLYQLSHLKKLKLHASITKSNLYYIIITLKHEIHFDLHV